MVKKHVIEYMKKWFNETAEENNLDIDDMVYDSLREQAEKLDILKYVQGDEYEEVDPEEDDQEELDRKRK